MCPAPEVVPTPRAVELSHTPHLVTGHGLIALSTLPAPGHLLPLWYAPPPNVVTGGAGELPIHGGNEVFLGSLEHAEVGFRQGQEGGRHSLDVLVLLHVLRWVLGGDIRGSKWGRSLDLFLPLFVGAEWPGAGPI